MSFLRSVALALLTCLLPVAPALAETIRIVAIGDSNFEVPRGLPRSAMYPAQLERALQARGHDVTVANQGIAGDTTMGVMRRMSSHVPDGTHIALVSVGINDVVSHGMTREQSVENVMQIVAALRARGIVTINLWTGKRFQRSAAEDPRYHVETSHRAGTTQWHLNEAGNAIVVRETIQQVIAAIEQVKRAQRPQRQRS